MPAQSGTSATYFPVRNQNGPDRDRAIGASIDDAGTAGSLRSRLMMCSKSPKTDSDEFFSQVAHRRTRANRLLGGAFHLDATTAPSAD
ncbi:MAG: hypothetical protein R3E58_07930 [Phycisphaerae bacterium]